MPAGTRIGDYEIVRRIAAGSMGTVYEVRQWAPERSVALKLMHPWLACQSSLERFRLELQILASLQHPSIASIYDAGIHRTDGPSGPSVPYYVMELIDGLPLSAHVAAEGVDRRARLQLFVTICDAVHHAHEHGVLHRDLKPSNILIDADGQPKLIDFGIARILEQEQQATALRTQVGQVLGTLAYMSPEQATGDADAVDRRADVYALGVILYELVTGKLPHDLARRTLAEALRIVQEEEPAALGKIDRQLRGDLEVVTAKALAKERDHRYASVAELAADVRRYLTEQPITARPAGLGYRIRKFTRRNRLASIALAAGATAVVVGIAATVTFGIEALRQRENADEAARQSAQVSSFLGEVFLAGATKVQLSPNALLDIVLRRLDEHGDELHPAAEATLRNLAGRACGFLSRSEEAVTHFERAWEIRGALGDGDDPRVLRIGFNLAGAYCGAGRVEDAQRQLRAVLEDRRRHYGSDHLSQLPQRRLAALITMLLPNEREAVWLRDQRQTEGMSTEQLPEPGQRFDGPVIVDDGFDGDTLGSHWSSWLDNALGWDHELANSCLTVRAIQPHAYATERGQPPSIAGLTLRVPHLTDFSVVLDFGWDSSSPDSGVDCRAMRSLSLVLVGADGQPIAFCAYDDAWFASEGQRRAKCGDSRVYPGHGTLPPSGTATIRIDRVGGRLTVFWDERAFLTATATEALAEVQIELSFMPWQIQGRRSHFGTLTLEHLRVEGIR